jgi:hypothetical protein
MPSLLDLSYRQHQLDGARVTHLARLSRKGD